MADTSTILAKDVAALLNNSSEISDTFFLTLSFFRKFLVCLDKYWASTYNGDRETTASERAMERDEGGEEMNWKDRCSIMDVARELLRRCYTQDDILTLRWWRYEFFTWDGVKQAHHRRSCHAE